MSFIAGRVCASPEEARAWVEANVKPEERHNWAVFEFEGWMEEDTSEPSKSQTIEGSVIPSKDKS